MRTITKTFKSEEEMIRSRITDKWSNNSAQILNTYRFIEVSRSAVRYDYGRLEFPITVNFCTRN